MRKRPLLELTLLTVATLGLYEIIWLVQTRNEMVSKYKVKIPSAAYAAISKFLQLAGFLIVVALVFYFIPLSSRDANHSANSRIKPSMGCFSEYDQSAQCRQAVDRYYASPTYSPLILTGIALAIITAAAALYWIYMRRWVTAYAIGVQKVTGEELSGVVSVLALGGIVPLLGMLYVQRAFNRT